MPKKPANPNHITKMNAKYEDIMRRKLSGDTNKEIAKDINLTVERVSFICNSPIFKDVLDKKRKSINKRFEKGIALDPVKRKFKDNANTAVDVIVNAMDNPSAKIRMTAANDVLGYGGYQKKPTEDHSTKILIHGDVYQGFKVAMKALKIDEKLLTDARLEGVVKQIDTENDRDKSESTSGAG